ncbi:hypothetical protein [Marinicellulosiphila megalodicopiae]|uniref:hypothetical protein n=1 Tax=Marinicellulosiphila megalodicopiae TaxID=2724896 RepID=UPI003BAED8E9
MPKHDMTRHDIAFLHTAEVHISTFQSLVESLNHTISVRHDVQPNLLKEAIEHGLTEKLKNDVNRTMQLAANTGAQVVVCTCSTIGGIAELTKQTGSCISMRIDRAMADLSVQTFNNILVVAAVESTLQPTQALLNESLTSANTQPKITLKQIPDTWEYFLAGDKKEYLNRIFEFIQNEKDGFDCVVLAQASMADAALRFKDSDICVLASPELGVKKAIEYLNKKSV